MGFGSFTGKGSWFGGPNDGMDSGKMASGFTTALPSVAIRFPGKSWRESRPYLGHYVRVTSKKNGRSAVFRIGDLGPNESTGRNVDITYSGLKRLGYNEKDFPTDSDFKVEYLGKKPTMKSGPVKQTGSSVKKVSSGFEDAFVSELMKGGKNPLLNAINRPAPETPIPEPKKPGNYDTGGTSPTATGSRRGRVSVLPGAERAGAKTQRGLLNVAQMVAGVYGKPLKIGTTTAHSRLTTTGNVSDHWDGWGADIPASGEALTRLGQSALIALGMPEAQARKIRGGAYTLKYGKNRRVQIIFNTNVGGNHYDHLHIGVSPV